MGGKARKRREKNYLAAHGGSSRLPPPPDSSSVDAIPSKLRKLMSLGGGGIASIGSGQKKKGDFDKVAENRKRIEDKLGLKSSEITSDCEDGNLVAQDPELGDEVVDNSKHEKKKRKRKRKQVNDLRFEAPERLASAGSKRKERRKQRSEERKKKKKGIKQRENVEFQARDEVKFGDVVQAPPKLVTVPKAFNTNKGASQERLRIKAVEAYRTRKGWELRPGVQLPTTVSMTPLPP